MENITVTWDDLQPEQKELVAQLFNNSAMGLPGKTNPLQAIHLWTSCDVFDPAMGFTKTGDQIEGDDFAIWDGYAEVTDSGLLKISGATGPSGGNGCQIIKVFPKTVQMRIGAYVGR